MFYMFYEAYAYASYVIQVQSARKNLRCKFTFKKCSAIYICVLELKDYIQHDFIALRKRKKGKKNIAL